MFQGLKDTINQQNYRKVKENQLSLGQSGSMYNSDESYQSQYSFEGDFAERMQTFKMLTSPIAHGCLANTQNQSEKRKFIKQKELLQEKVKINNQLHQQEIQYLKERSQRQLNTLKIQISKLEFLNKKQLKEQGLIQSLRKDNKRLLELNEGYQNSIECQRKEMTLLKRQIVQLKIVVKKKQEFQAQINLQKRDDPAIEKLNQQIKLFQQQKFAQIQKRKQLESTIQRLRQENDYLLRESDRISMIKDGQRMEEVQRYKSKLQRLQEDFKQLKDRNRIIEESFIDHLTQTSLNLQHTIKTSIQEKQLKNASLYLPESPIKARSKGKQRMKTPQEEQDPEKNYKPCKCGPQINRLKMKLSQANCKLVELLRDKCLNKTRPSLHL